MQRAEKDKLKFRLSLLLTLLAIGVLWIVKIIETSIDENAFAHYGVLPRDVSGLKGIFLYPFIHGDWDHLISNSIPLLVLGTIFLYTYSRVAIRSLFLIYILGGFWLWLIGNWGSDVTSYHIGASGMVYGIASFLAFSGMIRKDRQSTGIALFVILFYGGMVWGILPIQEGVSWEGHLTGAMAGMVAAFGFRNEGRPSVDQFSGEIEDQRPFFIKYADLRKQYEVPENRPLIFYSYHRSKD